MPQIVALTQSPLHVNFRTLLPSLESPPAACSDGPQDTIISTDEVVEVVVPNVLRSFNHRIIAQACWQRGFSAASLPPLQALRQ